MRAIGHKSPNPVLQGLYEKSPIYHRPFDSSRLALSPLLNTLIASGAQVALSVTPANSVNTIAWTPKQ